jgi:nucleotidyltransferase/DNA polymerase involved in DNA repair
MPMRKIIHLDMDAFYPSIAHGDNPELRGRPVAVGQCAELAFVPWHFRVYRAVSRRIHVIPADHTALIGPLALDEAYLDVTENRRGLPTVMGIGLLGVSVSVFDQSPADAADQLPLLGIGQITVPQPDAAPRLAAAGMH